MCTKAYSEISEKALITELYRRYRCQEEGLKKRIVLLGMPGAGKGTHSAKMLARFCMCHLSTGDLLREEVRSGSDFGKRLKGIMDRGELIEDEVMCNLIKYQLAKPACANGAILDGFPRTIPQAQKLDEILKQSGQQIDQAIFMNVREDTVTVSFKTFLYSTGLKIRMQIVIQLTVSIVWEVDGPIQLLEEHTTTSSILQNNTEKTILQERIQYREKTIKRVLSETDQECIRAKHLQLSTITDRGVFCMRSMQKDKWMKFGEKSRTLLNRNDQCILNLKYN